MPKIPQTIAIDGPAASGKSTLGKRLAERLGYLFFDTGVMYRAVTWAALEHSLSIEDEEAVSALAEAIDIDIRPASADDGRTADVLADGRDVTWEIRKRQVESHVSKVSSYGRVRTALSAQQRKIGERGRVVMVGRDIGTVVLPDAEHKIYLDASAEERARRRCEELLGQGKQAVYADVLEAMKARDTIDSTRALSPLRAAEDAVTVQSDHLTLDDVLAQVLDIVTPAA